jgi:hypothetical protein
MLTNVAYFHFRRSRFLLSFKIESRTLMFIEGYEHQSLLLKYIYFSKAETLRSSNYL